MKPRGAGPGAPGTARAAVVMACALCFLAVPAGSGSAQGKDAPKPGAAATAKSATLRELGDITGARIWYDPLTGTGGLERYGIFGSFAVGQPWLVWNWHESAPVPAPSEEGGALRFQPGFTAEAERRFEAYRAERARRYSVAAILIDPGHGGKDPGATAEHGEGAAAIRLAEKELTLAAARRIAGQLRARFPDRKILMTRDGDTYPTLEDRVEMANRVKLGEREAVIYVSIHANASFNRDVRGFEVWYLNPEYRRTVVDADTVKEKGKDIAPILNAMLEEEFTTESIILARDVLERLGAAIGGESPSRGIRAEEWFVVRNAKMPSILIEMGFVTNPGEARLLGDEGYLRRISDAIYNGIVDFIGHFEG